MIPMMVIYADNATGAVRFWVAIRREIGPWPYPGAWFYLSCRRILQSHQRHRRHAYRGRNRRGAGRQRAGPHIRGSNHIYNSLGHMVQDLASAWALYAGRI